MEHWTKKLFRKITPKHVQNTLGHFREQFGHLWNFDFFLIFWNHFEDSTLHGTLGKKHFRKNYTKTCSKHVGQFGNDFGRFWNFEKYFKDISKTRPSMEHWAKKFFRKNYPKTCSKYVWTIWEQFWAFLDFWKLFKNISMTRHSMEHLAKIFSKKLPQDMFKTRLDTFGNDSGHFWNFENF